MPRHQYHLLLYMLILPAFLVLFPACHRESEEDQVRKVVTRVQHAAEEKKIISVLEHVSKSYRDPQGNDYDGVKGLLAFYFFRHQKVGIFIPAIDVAVAGPEAKARFQAILTGKGSGDAAPSSVLPETLGAYDFEVLFKKEENKWKITSAKWERVGEGGGT